MSMYASTTPITDWSNCKRCRLHTTRRNVVIRRSGFVSNGTIRPLRIDHLQADPARLTLAHTKEPVSSLQQLATLLTRSHYETTNLPSIPYILFIGEAPGETEDSLGEPFVGASFNPLQYLLQLISKEHPGYKRLYTSICPKHNPPSPENCEVCSRNEQILLLKQKHCARAFFFTITNTVGCRPVHSAETTKHVKQHGTNRQPQEDEQYLCETHIVELLTLPFTHVVCLGNVAQERYAKIKSRFGARILPEAYNTKHPAWYLRQNYTLLSLLKAAEGLRKHL